MHTPYTRAMFTRVRGPFAMISLNLAGALLLAAGLLGCDTFSTSNGGGTGSQTAPTEAAKNASTIYQGRSFSPCEGTTLFETADELRIADTNGSWCVAVDVSDLEWLHAYHRPVHVPADGTFQAALRSTIKGTPTTLVSTRLVPQDDGSTLIVIGLQNTHQIASDSVTVVFQWKGQDQYRVRLPIQAQLPIAFYNTPGASPSKSATTDDEPTSGYWAYIDGTWVWMVDWTEGESGNKRLHPATLTPAFPAPLDEIPVDFLRIEFTLDTEDVSPDAMVFTGFNMPGITFTGVEY